MSVRIFCFAWSHFSTRALLSCEIEQKTGNDEAGGGEEPALGVNMSELLLDLCTDAVFTQDKRSSGAPILHPLPRLLVGEVRQSGRRAPLSIFFPLHLLGGACPRGL